LPNGGEKTRKTCNLRLRQKKLDFLRSRTAPGGNSLLKKKVERKDDRNQSMKIAKGIEGPRGGEKAGDFY